MSDWADRQANVIATTLELNGATPEVRAWLAARLRLIHCEGHAEGLAAASKVLEDVFRPPAPSQIAERIRNAAT
jgi:hypothetical protein